MMGGARYNLVRPGEDRCWQCHSSPLPAELYLLGAQKGDGVLATCTPPHTGPGDGLRQAAPATHAGHARSWASALGWNERGSKSRALAVPESGVWKLPLCFLPGCRQHIPGPPVAPAPGAPRAVAQRSVFGEHGDHWHFACVWALVRHCLGAVRGRIDAPRYLSSPDSTFSLASCCLGAFPCVQFEGHHTAAHADRCGCYPPGSRGCCRPCWQLCAAHLHVGQGMLCPRAKRGISLKSVEDAC
jgi:hypothetical protein